MGMGRNDDGKIAPKGSFQFLIKLISPRYLCVLPTHAVPMRVNIVGLVRINADMTREVLFMLLLSASTLSDQTASDGTSTVHKD